MATQSAILGLWAETSIHAGAGSSVDGVDLPIQREGHTGWPCIFGSAVKGALRAKAEETWGKSDSVRFVFGPESTSEKASEHAGALLVGDARLLLLPVRSLTGHFKWVTSPAVLSRLNRDTTRMGIAIPDFQLPEINETDAIQPLASKSSDLFLEEYRFSVKQTELTPLIETLAALSGIETRLLNEQLVIVNDSMFSYLSQYATPVAAHIAIDSEKKIVKKGALWYEETLPPETVLYITLSASKVRDQKARFNENKELNDQQAATVLKSITETLFKEGAYLQIGGNETVGMGWCKVNSYTGA